MKNESVSIPAHPKQMTSSENQELVSKLENVQSELLELENDFCEQLKLKDEHIQILTEHLQNLPAPILGQFQQMQHPQ